MTKLMIFTFSLISLFDIVVVSFLLIAAGITTLTTTTSVVHATVDYNDTTTWPGVCASGKRQSPVDFSSAENNLPGIYDGTLKPVIHFGNCLFSAHEIVVLNKIYKLQVELHHAEPAVACDMIDPTRDDSSRRFSLLQIHFHNPAEHVMNNSNRQQFEIHFVHNMSDSKTGEVKELLVLGLIGRVVPKPTIPDGNSNAALLDALLNAQILNSSSKSSVKSEEFSKIKTNLPTSATVDDFLPRNASYMTYSGSLTTPPCSEIVTWIVFNEVLNIWDTTFYRYRNFVKATYAAHEHGAPFVGNTRPAQPWNGRKARYFRDDIGEAARLAELAGSGKHGAFLPNGGEFVHNDVPGKGLSAGGIVGVAVGTLAIGIFVGVFVGRAISGKTTSRSKHQHDEATMDYQLEESSSSA